MKRMIAGTCLAAAFAVGLSAQTYPPQTQPPTPQTQPPAAQEPKDAAKNVTVTGCLKAGDQPDTFILSDLKFKKDDKAVGTSGSAAAPIAASTLKLIGSPSAKLSEHLNKTVEVSGMISDGKGGHAVDAAVTERPAAREGRSHAQREDREHGVEFLLGAVENQRETITPQRSWTTPARHSVGLAFVCVAL